MKILDKAMKGVSSLRRVLWCKHSKIIIDITRDIGWKWDSNIESLHPCWTSLHLSVYRHVVAKVLVKYHSFWGLLL